ncbi:Binding isoform 1 [Dorcoceras hygrometricum]|uniref:Binding isoform 1 n=1 Tax=Dorcoceras hygrometricum TaxID=472368 RepID=A0A2Z7BDF5_9LAMI|nr:Binding isoform 1 [Dorcoceras hygrometricum]
MFRAFWNSACKGGVVNSSFSQYNYQRGMHTRNKKALELIAKGFSALKEVDRVIDYCELNDKRLIPLLRTAKQHFELALEADNTNTHARYWLSKLHFKYHVPGANKAVGAALLVEAAEMGDPDALYEMGCRLRVENDYVQSDQQAFYFIEKAVDQLHPAALYLLGAVYLTGDCVNKDVSSAIWCFHRASEKGHAGAAIAYGSLLLRVVVVVDVIVILIVILQNDYVQSDQQAFYFIEKAVDQLHPAALYLLGAVYLTGDCVNKDVSSAIWCFHRASEKGHAGAAIAYGSLLLRG